MRTLALKTLPFRIKLAVRASVQLLRDFNHAVQVIGLFVGIVVLLQWLFSVELFWNIVTTSGFGPLDMVDFFATAFTRIFTEIGDLTPISFVGIAFFQSISIRMLIAIRRGASGRTSSVKSLFFGLIGSGCVACGGSLLSPVLGLIASGVSVAAAEAIGDVLLLFSLGLSVSSWLKIAPGYIAQKAPGEDHV